LLARVVRIVVGIVALIIVAGILLFVLKANPTNSVVSTVHDAAHSLVGPFNGMFSFHSANVAIAVNWGIAALVYLVLGGSGGLQVLVNGKPVRTIQVGGLSRLYTLLSYPNVREGELELRFAPGVTAYAFTFG